MLEYRLEVRRQIAGTFVGAQGGHAGPRLHDDVATRYRAARLSSQRSLGFELLDEFAFEKFAGRPFGNFFDYAH